jgi:hypothetical protein
MSLPATPLNVQWRELSPRKYEDLGSVLLSRMYPESIRTDGSGGDGGKDVHFEDSNGLTIFELKSFTGRVTAGRRTQVRNSFRKAQELKPKTWVVVCPIDLTNEERKWFEKLTADTGIECFWYGKTWLDARMTEFPSVARYFTSDVNNELKELAQLFQREQAALSGGVPDALDRLRALQAKCDELDPFYRIDLATNSDGVSATLTPRYVGAERDRPITMNARLRFPDSASSTEILSGLQDAIDFGRAANVPAEFVQEVSIDAPAGLGGEFGAGILSIGPSEIVAAPQFNLHLILNDAQGTRIGMLPLSGSLKTAGRKGFVGEFRDDSGLINATLRVDFTDKTLEFTFRYEAVPRLPRAMLPALAFLAECESGNLVELQLETGQPLGPPVALIKEPIPRVRDFVRAVELLGRVQEATLSYFNVPDSFTVENLEDLTFADRLLKGEKIEGTWTRFNGKFSGAYAKDILEHLRDSGGIDGGACSLVHVAELTLDFDSHQMPLGWVTTHLPSAKMLDSERTAEVLSEAEPDDEVPVTFEPGNSDATTRWKGVPEGFELGGVSS